MGGREEGTSLEYTPTWVVAGVCTVIVSISLAAERLLHYAGKYLKKKNQKPLYQALQKVKEELMLLGFISLLLTVFQNTLSKICIPEHVVQHMLPCALNATTTTPTSHYQSFFSSLISGKIRRLLSEESLETGYCAKKGRVPLLSLEALHHLHIFIFILAIVHVTFCVLTVVFGGAKIRQWKRWEDSIAKENYDTQQVLKKKVTHVHQHDFIRDHFSGIGKRSNLLGWLYSFFKQFYASVTKSDYMTLRLGFIMTHCSGNPKFNFHNYMTRALEDDFKIVVGISWYLWVFVVIFLLLNINDVFPPCKLPPHKRQLDALLSDTQIDRSVSHLLGYTQLNSRLRQTGSYSSPVKKKVIVVDSTVSEESDSDSDSGSEYHPTTDMSRVGDGAVLSELDVQKNKRQAINEAKKAKMSKVGSGSRGKATIGSSSPCVTGDETVLIPAPTRKVTVDRVRVPRSPTSYDVDRCVRWEAPLTGGGTAADAPSLPLLPRPCNAQGFGVIGAPPQYAYDVIAPYMTFGGDVERVQFESFEDSFGFLLENSAEQLARLSIYSRSMLEGKREMDARYQECQTRYQECQTRYQECQTEIGRMQGVIDQGVARQNQLVQDAIAAYDRGLKEGSVDGWHEAVKAYREAGHLDPSVVDSVPCHLGISDEEVDPMEGGGVGGSGAADASDDRMLP